MITIPLCFIPMTLLNLIFFKERPAAINYAFMIASFVIFIGGRLFIKKKWRDYIELVHLQCSNCRYKIFSEQTPDQADGICTKCGENNRVTQNI